jgi:tetratricopeptide (TPR) repeat protein
MHLIKLSTSYFCITIKPIQLTVGNFEQSVLYFKEGNFEAALKMINGCIEDDRSNLEFIFFRARVSTRLGLLEDSLKDFDTLVKMEPYNPTYIGDRAVVLHLLKRNAEAEEGFDQALNLEPSNPYRYSSRAYFKDRIGDLSGAIEDYEKAIDLDPEDAVAYNNKGLVEEKLGYQEKSRKSFNKADELVGYKPENHKKDVNVLNQNEAVEENPARFSFKGYFEIVKKVVTEKSTREEFWNFLRGGLKQRR